MKFPQTAIILLSLTVLPLLRAGDADPVDDAIAKAKLDAAESLKSATAELVATRTRITAERTPLAEQTRAIEARVAALESEIVRLETDHANLADSRQQLRRDAEGDKRNLGYLFSQAQECLKSFDEALSPGERVVWGTELNQLREALGKSNAAEGAPLAMATGDLAARRLRRQIGGYTAKGQAVDDRDNRVLAGLFVFDGPEVFFRSEDGRTLGSVMRRNGGEWPAVHPVAAWTTAQAGQIFEYGAGQAPLDATGGKAIALRMRQGSILDQVRRGGVVGYAILSIGLLAIAIAVQKLFDFRKLAVDEPPAVRGVLGKIAAGAHGEAERLAQSLKATTRDLFLIGLLHRHKPKALLEEHLESYVLQQRMLQERRLPMLAVIATSGPLLGLLGTVTGMIKTFTLITVFGTGSAGKLSAGISEALIATKFGLMVAIPALVVHGFLSQRIQKHLAMLERYALEIATANEESRKEERREGVSAR